MHIHAVLLHSMPSQAKIVLASTHNCDPTVSAQGILLLYCSHSCCTTLPDIDCVKQVLFSPGQQAFAVAAVFSVQYPSG